MSKYSDLIGNDMYNYFVELYTNQEQFHYIKRIANDADGRVIMFRDLPYQDKEDIISDVFVTMFENHAQANFVVECDVNDVPNKKRDLNSFRSEWHLTNYIRKAIINKASVYHDRAIKTWEMQDGFKYLGGDLDLGFTSWDDESRMVNVEGMAVESFKEYLQTVTPKVGDILKDVIICNTPLKDVALKHSITESNAKVISHRAKQDIKQLSIERLKSKVTININTDDIIMLLDDKEPKVKPKKKSKVKKKLPVDESKPKNGKAHRFPKHALPFLKYYLE